MASMTTSVSSTNNLPPSGHTIVEDFATLVNSSSTLRTAHTLSNLDEEEFIKILKDQSSYNSSTDISKLYEEDISLKSDIQAVESLKSLTSPNGSESRSRKLSLALSPKVKTSSVILEQMAKFEPSQPNADDDHKDLVQSARAKTSKVKKIAEMFSAKINQIVKSDAIMPKAKSIPKPRIKLPTVRVQLASPSLRRRRKSFSKTIPTCLVAEEVFAKLTVKEKARIFNQFLNDLNFKSPIFKRNSRCFGKSGKLTKTKALEEDEMIVSEEPMTVKSLARKLEAKMETFSTAYIKEMAKKPNAKSPSKEKLQPMENATEISNYSPATKKKAAYSPYASPRKIRRAPAADRMVAVPSNQHLHRLFYSWIKEKNDLSFFDNGKKFLEDEVTKTVEQKTNVDQQKSDNQKTTVDVTETNPSNDVFGLIKKFDSKKVPTHCLADQETCPEMRLPTNQKSSPVLVNNGNQEINKLDQSNLEALDKEFQFLKPIKPIRRKKMRRQVVWKKEHSIVEKVPVLTTDSDSDVIVPQKHTLQSAKNENVTFITCSTDANASTNLKRYESGLQDSCDDQGFETGSNDFDSPIHMTKNKIPKMPPSLEPSSPLFIKISEDSDCLSPKTKSMSSINPAAFSTPIKTSDYKRCHLLASFSPIQTQATSRRRSSIYEPDPIQMNIIHEENHLQSSGVDSPDSFQDEVFLPSNRSSFFGKTEASIEKTSSFWISSGDFTVSMDIFHNTPDRVCLLYEIFSQKNVDTRGDIHFGIDDMKYSTDSDKPAQEEKLITNRLPRKRGCSHYWFSTGDLAVPFTGKHLSPDKTKRLFEFIRGSASSSGGDLRFGVDGYDFSKLPDPSTSCQKLSMESGYSMLIGLSGKNNGLEERSKFIWPSTTIGAKRSDFDQSICDSEDFNASLLRDRQLFSTFGSNNNNNFDLSLFSCEESMVAGNDDDALSSSEIFNGNFENEPLDKLFEKNVNIDVLKSMNSGGGDYKRMKSFTAQKQQVRPKNNIPSILTVATDFQENIRADCRVSCTF